MCPNTTTKSIRRSTPLPFLSPLTQYPKLFFEREREDTLLGPIVFGFPLVHRVEDIVRRIYIIYIEDSTYTYITDSANNL